MVLKNRIIKLEQREAAKANGEPIRLPGETLTAFNNRRAAAFRQSLGKCRTMLDVLRENYQWP
ncbi:hypothetical protein [Methylovulum miyakonense]|uniref:hypothetical protein n=1 Tax=Methylovulum miyakonense TaxID=645578 RepID=UPI00036493B0|nr:hypothetical protein [Methylovulum miyakonense]